MFVDTHCHLNMCVKDEFDRALSPLEIQSAHTIAEKSRAMNVKKIINVGTSRIESINCITLAHGVAHMYAAVGIHPNDCTHEWRDDIQALAPYLKDKERYKIVAIGECGLDKHYPGYDIQRQRDAFMYQIELAHTYDLALIVHSRDAAEETLHCLEQVKHEIRGVIHCFSEGDPFAQTVISWGMYLGIGGTITYPKNDALRAVLKNVCLEHIVLETDAPFLTPQAQRGKKNSPEYLSYVGEALASLYNCAPEYVARVTTDNAEKLFRI